MKCALGYTTGRFKSKLLWNWEKEPKCSSPGSHEGLELSSRHSNVATTITVEWLYCADSQLDHPAVKTASKLQSNKTLFQKFTDMLPMASCKSVSGPDVFSEQTSENYTDWNSPLPPWKPRFLAAARVRVQRGGSRDVCWHVLEAKTCPSFTVKHNEVRILSRWIQIKKRGIEMFWLRQWQQLNPHDCLQRSQNRSASEQPGAPGGDFSCG